MGKKKKINWIWISLVASLIAFLISWLFIGNWKISLILSVIAGLITISFNPIRRYIKFCWVCISLLVSTNTFSLKLAIIFFGDSSLGQVETQLGVQSITLSILLFLLCVFFGFMDYLERNDRDVKFFGTSKKGRMLVKNEDKVEKQINIDKNDGKIEM